MALLRRLAAARPTVSCLVGVLLASGCARGVEPYPSAWRPLRAAGCNAVVGVYENIGEGAKGGPGEPLFKLLVAVYDYDNPRRNGDGSAMIAPGPVTITMPEPGVLEARTRRLSQRFVARNGEFACTQGGLEFTRTGGAGGNVGGWFGSSVVRVETDEDGQLVVSRDEAGFGLLAWVIPIYMSFTNWSRFKPVTDVRAQEVLPAGDVRAQEGLPVGDMVEVVALSPPRIRSPQRLHRVRDDRNRSLRVAVQR